MKSTGFTDSLIEDVLGSKNQDDRHFSFKNARGRSPKLRRRKVREERRHFAIFITSENLKND